MTLGVGLAPSGGVVAAPLSAGVAKVDITNREAGPVNDPLYVKALLLKTDTCTAAIITVDAVAIGEIGYIKNDYLPKVRARLEKELGIPPANVLINASHCHGVVCADVAERTVLAVKTAVDAVVQEAAAGLFEAGRAEGESPERVDPNADA